MVDSRFGWVKVESALLNPLNVNHNEPLAGSSLPGREFYVSQNWVAGGEFRFDLDFDRSPFRVRWYRIEGDRGRRFFRKQDSAGAR